MAVEDRRAQLVDAALAVAASEGVSATTVRRVADRAGVALGVVHYAFADKDEMLAALAARVVERLAGAGESGLTVAGTPDLPAALDAVLSSLWELIEATRGEQLLTYEITTYALRNRELGSAARRQYEVSQAAVERMLTLAADASGSRWTRPLPELAGEALALLDGVTLRWLVDRDGAAARGRLSAFARYLATLSRRVRSRKRTP
jgi:AcrR family transcriptional regulator